MLISSRRDKWGRQQDTHGVVLTYARGKGDAIDLLQSPENGAWSEFTAPNSLREVEVSTNLLLHTVDPSDNPGATFPPPPDDLSDEPGAPASEDPDFADADLELVVEDL
jgi:hypothetical protein